jgi:uncharacterized protein DUF4136
MARVLHITGALLLIVMLSPRAAVPQTVTFDYNRTANFARLRTFALREGKLSDNQLLNDRITASITGVLSGRGLRQADSPDMDVAPSLTFETRKELTVYDPWYGGPFGWYGSYRWYGPFGWNEPYSWGGGWATYQVRDVDYATLTIDIRDAKEGSMLWRGKGLREVNPYWKADTIDKKVYKLVTKILRNFPPNSGH